MNERSTIEEKFRRLIEKMYYYNRNIYAKTFINTKVRDIYIQSRCFIPGQSMPA